VDNYNINIVDNKNNVLYKLIWIRNWGFIKVNAAIQR